MSPRLRSKIDCCRAIFRRVPFYFMIATTAIFFLAVAQFLLLDHMPIGNDEQEQAIPNYRMLSIDTIQGGKRAVASYYSFQDSPKRSIDLSLSVFHADDLSRTQVIEKSGMLTGKISPCGEFLVSTNRRGLAHLYQINDLAMPLRVLELPEGSSHIVSVWWSPDSRRILLSTETGVCVWDRDLDEWVFRMPTDPSSEVTASPSAEVFCIRRSSVFRLIDWNSLEVSSELHLDLSARTISTSSDGRIVAYLLGNQLNLIDSRTNRSLLAHPYTVPTSVPKPYALSSDGKLLAVAQLDMRTFQYHIQVTQISGDMVVCTTEPSAAPIAGVTFSPDSIWSWTPGGQIQKWNIQLPSNDSRFVLRTHLGEAFQ